MKKILILLFCFLFFAFLAFATPVSVATPTSGPWTVSGAAVYTHLYVDSISNTALPILIRRDGTIVRRIFLGFPTGTIERLINLFDLKVNSSITIDFGTNTGTATLKRR